MRDDAGWSQKVAGEHCGMHRTYYGGIERGERNASYTNLLKIAAAFEVSLSELQARAEYLAISSDPGPSANGR